ncbi:MAG: histidinol-phosphate aminotransferase family protein [Clostridiales bacterium]|nr:histidinol-phosphate aminotransferase family protein [Clostridiales bacterium]
MYYVNPVIKDFVRTSQPEGRGKYVRLDQNENPDGLPKWIFDEVMDKVTPELLSMYPEETAFTKKYAEFLGCDIDNVTLTDGSVVAMGYVINVFGEPNRKLICVNPTFGMYKVYADMKQMNTVFVPYNEDFTFDTRKLLEQIDNETSIVSIVNPNMPIGNIYSMDEIIVIIEKAKENDAVVIIDEAYYYFYDISAIELIKKYDNVVILRTFSKMLSICGLRMGAVISSKENIQYIKNYKPHYTVNCLALLFGEAIIDHHDKLITELKSKFIGGRDYLLQKLEHENYNYIPSYGCFICITPKHKTVEHIAEELKKRGVLIFCGKGASAGFLRVTIWDKKYMEMFMNLLLEIDIK